MKVFDNIIKSNFSYLMNNVTLKNQKTQLYKHTLGVLLKIHFLCPNETLLASLKLR